MVKFGMGNHQIGIVASKLGHICAIPKMTAHQQVLNQTTPDEIGSSASALLQKRIESKLSSLDDLNIGPDSCPKTFWNDEVILSSFRAPERDRRLEQISPNLANTFNWAYYNASIGLTEWLRKGSGIFWINGKPASGKSTIMKYLYQDPRTYELLRAGSWRSKRRLMTANFFFHHRGSSLQKSFEGLLRSLISQILEEQRLLLPLLYPMLAEKYQSRVTSSGLSDLETDIWSLLSHLGISRESCVVSDVGKIVASQRRLTQSRRLGEYLKRMLEGFGISFTAKTPENEVDLDDAENIMRASVTLWSQLRGRDVTEWPEPTSWKAVLTRTITRHYRREKIKCDIESQSWAGADLEEALQKIVGQSLFKLDLFLFLDALDEYDGRPEFIASFLQDLVHQSDNSDANSATRVRILFSSRPWEVFNHEFAACPGFQIHEYTRNDIMDFCAASMPPDDTAASFLSPLVNEIVRRARGVFLWVELVMRDLANTVLPKVQQQDLKGLEQDIRKTLDALPDELDDYYRVIAQRMSSGTRWETYVILETLCRSDEDVDTETLLAILHCASSKDYAEAVRRLEKSQRDLEEYPVASRLEVGERLIKVVSGGLVEIGGLSDSGKPVWQYMHQTVKEFVEDPCFKFLLLGNKTGKVVTENGHSFIAKHLFVLANIDKLFLYHAKKAESTMGFSQYDFFATAPQYFYGDIIPKLPYADVLYSLVELAAFSGLQLCIGDAFKADPCCIQRSHRDLIKIMFEGAAGPLGQVESVDLEHITDLAESLVAMGLVIDENLQGLRLVMQRMWGHPHALYGLSTRGGAHRNDPLPQYERLAVILVEAFPRQHATLTGSGEPSDEAASTTSFPARPTTSSDVDLATELIHSATPRLAEALLVRGVDPNSLNGAGETPMDSVIRYANRRTIRDDSDYRYHLMCLLASCGGLLGSTKRPQWNAWSDSCLKMGLDMRVFQKAGFPRWCPPTLPAAGQMADQGALDTRRSDKDPSLWIRYISRAFRNWNE